MRFIDVEVTTPSVEKVVPFPEETIEDGDEYVGFEEVTTRGVDGSKRETYENVFHDGELHSSTLVEEEVLVPAVAQVTTVGTKESPGGPLDLTRAATWDAIAQCESNQRWGINTGNGYYGGLQFNLATWRSVNGDDFAAYPHQATREEQITVANRLYERRGLQPWSCARVVR